MPQHYILQRYTGMCGAVLYRTVQYLVRQSCLALPCEYVKHTRAVLPVQAEGLAAMETLARSLRAAIP